MVHAVQMATVDNVQLLIAQALDFALKLKSMELMDAQNVQNPPTDNEKP